jgi:hypothetical protein
VECRSGNDLGDRGDHQLREVQAHEDGRAFGPEPAVSHPLPGAGRLGGGKTPHEQRQRRSKDKGAGGVDAVRRRATPDGNEGRHHLAGQSGEHRHREPEPYRVPVAEMVVEGGQQERRDHQSDGEQRRRARLRTEIAERVAAEQVEAAGHSCGRQRRPERHDGAHTGVAKTTAHHRSFDAADVGGWHCYRRHQLGCTCPQLVNETKRDGGAGSDGRPPAPPSSNRVSP